MGKSASGKDAIFRYLKENKALELKEIVPYTTRPMRKGEENGVGYYFVDNAAYEAMRREGKVIESRSYDTIQGKWHYFTADDGQINLSEGSSILIGTLEVYVQLKKYFGEDQVVPLYVEVEDGLRLERALSRERMQDEPDYAEEHYDKANAAYSVGGPETAVNMLNENLDLDKCCLEIVRTIKAF